MERKFGRGSLTNWISDLSIRAKDQGLAQGETIRPNLNLAINGNNVTDEELEDFRRALAASAEAGPSDEVQELGRIVDKKSEGAFVWWQDACGAIGNTEEAATPA